MLLKNWNNRPCFVADSKLRYYLSRYHGKEEISAAKSQHSIYQQGFGMIFCNPGPIAASCYLAKEVVSAAIQAFIAAIWDLTQLGNDPKTLNKMFRIWLGYGLRILHLEDYQQELELYL